VRRGDRFFEFDAEAGAEAGVTWPSCQSIGVLRMSAWKPPRVWMLSRIGTWGRGLKFVF
jgi:hypothetical protein